ncbi:site-specific tyrosine recombinase/integron integrase [Metabacillus halosaccharovorans]|uniref:site-specific tyrosine recombinase/integron integrase n=1 Tax=Metabacillus halosaccharovorans TaxID=930124 RepID=UPI00203B9E65|nr:site-specific tyrosine recombinase/integron integrase [Metabacillus halosaccharovorans]MCM3444390.1 tyrosine-type recombinase/integrase [Metabacillus halosaccharovorans]
MNDTARLMNDLEVIVSTLAPETEQDKLYIRLEEVLSNYEIHRKTQKEIENDIQEKIDLFLSSRKIEGLSNKTLKGYKIELDLFARFVQKPVVQINTADVRKYLAHNDKWMVSTLDRKLSVLKTFFSWLVREELLLRDATAKIRAPKKPKRLIKSLTIEELEIVRDSCETLRERALIETMYATGCRLSEIKNMKKSDINLQQMSVRVIGKGDKERICYLSIKCLHQLRKYLNGRNDDCEYLFVTERKPIRKMSDRNIERIIDIIEDRSNLSKKLTPHVFRHTFAQLAMENGAELADVQHLMGHENPSTTLVYSHVSEERKKQAHKRYHVQ